jgi:hypothetical protein
VNNPKSRSIPLLEGARGGLRRIHGMFPNPVLNDAQNTLYVNCHKTSINKPLRGYLYVHVCYSPGVARPPLYRLCRWATDGYVSITICHPVCVALAFTMSELSPVEGVTLCWALGTPRLKTCSLSLILMGSLRLTHPYTYCTKKTQWGLNVCLLYYVINHCE